MKGKQQFQRIIYIQPDVSNCQQQYPRRIENLKQERLFANNYNMTQDYYTEDGTNRAIRKQILIKYGRLLPLNKSFGIESEGEQSLNQPKKSIYFISDPHRQEFQKIKQFIPASPSRKMPRDVHTRTNLLIEQDDLYLAQNHSLFTKLASSMQQTELWEKALVTRKNNEDQLISLKNNYQNCQKTQSIQKRLSRSKNLAMEFLPSINHATKNQNMHSIKSGTQSSRKRSSSTFDFNPDLGLLDSDLCKIDGKHLILLKNLYAY